MTNCHKQKRHQQSQKATQMDNSNTAQTQYIKKEAQPAPSNNKLGKNTNPQNYPRYKPRITKSNGAN